MRTSRSAVALVVVAVLAVAGCSDDDTDLDTGSSTDSTTTSAPGGGEATAPDRRPDLVGTITAVEPFVPITEDCTPPEDLDPDGAVSSDDPPVCTPEGNDVVGTVLVEEQPGVQEGRKISYTVTTGTAITGETADGEPVGSFADLAEGQLVDSWVPVDGMCAESYPEQCAADALRVTG